jgi:hypothetical protein
MAIRVATSFSGVKDAEKVNGVGVVWGVTNAEEETREEKASEVLLQTAVRALTKV